MNIPNLQRMVGLLKTVDESQFNMKVFSNDIYGTTAERVDTLIKDEYKCNSGGCVIGHSIVLDTELFNKVLIINPLADKENGRYKNLDEAYAYWSEKFTGLIANSTDWEWCFGADWVTHDNTVAGAISRIEALLSGTIESHKDYETFLMYVI